MKKITILVPDLPESITEATVAIWHKNIGDIIQYNENIVDIETDKVMLEIVSPCTGILNQILEKEGSIVISQQILGNILISEFNKNSISQASIVNTKNVHTDLATIDNKKIQDFTPSIRRLIQIYKIDSSLIHSTGINKSITRKDIINHIEKKTPVTSLDLSPKKTENIKNSLNNQYNRVKMTRIRQRIAERLLESKNNTAMLTTFNEVNMKPITLLRKKYGDQFKEKHGIRIGLMSFYVKAVVESLKKFPEINASIDGKDIIYYKNFDISIAISTKKGLITPVLRNADIMSMSEIEKKIQEFSIKAQDNKITISDLIGGNFTITNGGIFGSLMSTPIINPPQTAILGMHLIKDRPMAVNGKIKILPMMYLALSYDHRLVDGKESVRFLLNIKNILEDFTRVLIEV